MSCHKESLNGMTCQRVELKALLGVPFPERPERNHNPLRIVITVKAAVEKMLKAATICVKKNMFHG